MKLTAVEAIVGALNSANVRYLVAGGLAVNAHGYSLQTLIDMKEAAGRARDMDDIQHLRWILEDQRHGK